MSAFCPSCPPAAVRGIAGGGLRPRLPLRPARGAPRVAALSPGVAGKSSRTAIVRAGVDGGSDETVEEDATTAVSPRIPEKQEEEEEVPIWVKRERIRKMEAEQGMMEFPWPIYLSVSILMSIAVVGVVFEFFNKNPYFGVVQPDNILYIPIFALFVLAGVPLAGLGRSHHC